MEVSLDRTVDRKTRSDLLTWQRNEITEHHVYLGLAERTGSEENADLLRRMAEDEKKHYETLRKHTGEDRAPHRWRLRTYRILSRVFGLTFTLKLMERREAAAQESYARVRGKIAEIDEILEDENRHEEHLVGFIEEEHFRYADAMVLGLNDALVEMTGALAGLTLALRETSLIALSALTTGLAAAMSMAASEYLSIKAGETKDKPIKAAAYTGISYVCVVALLVVPYFVLSNYYACLASSVIIAVSIIAVFNYYMALAKGLSFKKRFGEMAVLSLSVAGLSFLVGYTLRAAFGIDV